MANRFLSLPSKPDLYMMISPPFYGDDGINPTVTNEILPELIP
jgi:hypothetical protein